jgi:hypothetical protein
MAKLVTLQLAPVFHNFRSRVEDLRDKVLVESGKIVRREEQASIRRLWYDTGRTLNSLEEQIVTKDASRSYVLSVTATNERGAPYPVFGEYGTGRRGAASGRPAPRGYRYGDRAGMTARRFSRIAITTSKPQVERAVENLARSFTLN